jgi:hypothetical protein
MNGKGTREKGEVQLLSYCDIDIDIDEKTKRRSKEKIIENNE